jgi:hypothetical protein
VVQEQKGALQVLHHAVERTRQLTDFIAALYVRPRAEISGGDAPGGFCQLLRRTGYSDCYNCSNSQAQQQDKRDPNSKTPGDRNRCIVNQQNVI